MPQKPKVRCSRSTLTSASGSAGIGGVKKKDSARRCLFGKPGKKGTDTWLANSLKQIDGSRASKFNFDFENDRPMVDEDGEYVFEAVDEKEVPSFYRTKIYLPEERHRRIAPPPIAAENEVVPRIEAEEEDQHLGDYVAMNTRSRDVARNTASACMASTSAGSAASVVTDGSGRSVSEPGNVRKTVGKPETKKQVSEAGVSGKRKRPMKQPIITSEHLKVVFNLAPHLLLNPIFVATDMVSDLSSLTVECKFE
ncbi:Cyclin-dependent kinase inhibitor 1 [Toxocara canis]|uniref:Cyclin-dependent kinase inhibitor 1 n=1 Tax=Toxocara canis TaxID=6265 RepID=A0A0B2UTP8_TOXCA|nr:Cyclin-dependent kinase inhibitor 1 [Toxocara canis]